MAERYQALEAEGIRLVIDVEAGPPHGWTANGSWRHLAAEALPGGGTVRRFELVERVMGARVVKELRLIDGHPFIYQRHVFEGGEGALPVSHHAMTRAASPTCAPIRSPRGTKTF